MISNKHIKLSLCYSTGRHYINILTIIESDEAFLYFLVFALFRDNRRIFSKSESVWKESLFFKQSAGSFMETS